MISEAKGTRYGKMDELKEEYMREAIKEAEKAAAMGEVPIGAVMRLEG